MIGVSNGGPIALKRLFAELPPLDAATGWIIKPFKPEQLIAVVKKVLG